MFDRIIEQTRDQSVLSFDFIILLTVASSISAVGLAINSVVAIVASMLISPLMGPILAWSFGTVILDFSLVRRAAFTEMVAVLNCFIGFF
jgi:uncharacterized membrane protein